MHHTDIDTSANFIDKFKHVFGKGRVLDCGAGMGRITKALLLPRFEKVDMIEPAPSQIEKAK